MILCFQIEDLSKIFWCPNLKRICQILSSNAEFNRGLTRSSNCSDMFADSSGNFQVIVRFNLSNGRQKGQAQSIHIYGIVLRRCC